MPSPLQDVRHGARSLLQRPGFTLVAVLTLALGIGASTAIFTVVDAVLLRPLPYDDPERLVILWLDNRVQGVDDDVTSYPNYEDWRDEGKSFASMAAYVQPQLNLTGGGSGEGREPERVRGARVTASFFPTLGVDPAFGRAFRVEEEQRGQNQVAILGHDLWQRRFGGDQGVLGRTIELDGSAVTVVGVMRAGFAYPNGAEVWTPLAPDDMLRTARGLLWLRVIGRLAPGAALERASAEMATVAARLESQYPETNTGHGVRLQPLNDAVVGGQVRRSLVVLLAAVGCLLLIACVNVANLLLARATVRAREVAVRTALGAGRGRLIRQLLVESLLLGLLGGAAGALLAVWGVRALIALGPADFPRRAEIAVDGTALAFAFALALATGLLFGLVPALHASRPDFGTLLKDGEKGSAGRGGPARSLLVVAEVAIAVVLLVGAGLLAESFRRLRTADTGLRTQGALAVRLDLPRGLYSDPTAIAAFSRALLERVRALPGVESVQTVNALFPGEGFQSSDFTIEGRPPAAAGQRVEVTMSTASPGFFRGLGIPLRAGRELTAADGPDAPPVVVISEEVARRWWPGESPLGRRIRFGGSDAGEVPWMEIVGVVGDVQVPGVEVQRPATYQSSLQNPSRSFLLVVRTAGDPLALARPVREAVWAVDPRQAVSQIDTLDNLLAVQVAKQRWSALLLGLFAGVALVLALVGIYGVLSYSVQQSTREIGIRMALGARRETVVRMVVARAARLALAGVAVGLALAWFATRALASLLHEVSATDPATFAAMAVLLLGAALLAGYLPARRATAVDPVTALRTP